MTETEPIDPRRDAVNAAVPGARGWFRPANGDGGINLRLAGSVQVAAFDDGTYRLVIPESGFVLSPGPYDDQADAALVCDAVLQLSYDDALWPVVTAGGAAGTGTDTSGADTSGTDATAADGPAADGGAGATGGA